MTAPTHFLDLDQFDADTLRAMLKLGSDFKRGAVAEDQRRPLAGKTLAMIFEKPSTRTRVSFEVGMRQLGGDVVNLSNGASQLGRGETIADTARVLSRYCDAIMIRTDDPAKLHELALHASIPVINGLTDETHPCQVMADVMTFEEHRGSIAGKVVCWSGDGNNVAASWIQAAAHFGFEMRVACPENREPDASVVQWARDRGASIVIGRDPQALAQGADCVVTDTWVSMHEEGANLHNLLRPYQVNGALMRAAAPDALFMHCLPCHREEEVTSEVIDGPQSVVWDEAENRLHAQKGILAWCLTRS
ncbi:ornithine carbamoyltransferase [Caenispirillum bisanense]|uniref:Ornithine carbamoyltransferase n=1 Tax=Caenispirillum bisanense TaxID=414052 RepID=A0A286GWP4_9PROT|nr:ornithine carbamoyltransferase [Caenispirillum bisanense]SOD99950.1 ornithine carbamoyltransferase [Caenispirillum bisanense]